MGILKKVFKPIAKVLDKVIPNEIKPALPYLAAFAPYFGPTSAMMGQGIMRRALISGALNIGGQLAQEGNEGDINLLSAGLGALSGAMTAPGAADTFAGSRIAGTGADGKAITASEYAKLSEGANLGTGTQIAGSIDPGVITAPIQGPVPFSQVVPGGEAGLTGLAKTKNLALTGLEKGSKFISEGMAGGLKDKAQVLALPAATATGDLMQAEARQLEKQAAIDAALAEAEALADAGMRGDAIRNAMRAYGFFSDEEIEDTVSSAGYRAGGRVGFDRGGLGALGAMMLPKETEENFLTIDGGEGLKLFMTDNIDKPIIKESYSQEDSGRRNEAFFVILNPETGTTSTISQEDYFEKYGEPKAKGGRVGFRFGGIDEAIEMVEKETVEKGKEGIMTAAGEDPLLIEEYNKYVFDLLEQRPNAKPMSFQEFKRMTKAGMKEGGLMDLGGKEMDLRGGGFVPIGKKERADDVPARLSKNEFVMTADAVRAAGGGSVNKGAKRMYNLMNTLEARA